MYAAHRQPASSGQQDADQVEVRGPEVRQQEDSRRGERHPEQVERTPRAGHGHAQRADELDRDRDAQRDAVDRRVDRQVHGREDHPEDSDEAPVRRRPPADARPPGQHQDERGERLAEQHGARGADLVEDGLPEGRAELDRRHRRQHEKCGRYTVGADHGGAPYRGARAHPRGAGADLRGGRRAVRARGPRRHVGERRGHARARRRHADPRGEQVRSAAAPCSPRSWSATPASAG